MALCDSDITYALCCMLERTVAPVALLEELTVDTTIGLSSIPVMFRLGKNVDTEFQSAGNQQQIRMESSLVGSSETTRTTASSFNSQFCQ